jgi:transcriptional regulator with XRE-family HTH domain
MKTSPTDLKSPNPIDVAVGAKARHFRTIRQMSQTDLAKMLGITFQQIQKYEAGSNRVSASRLYQMAQSLGVTPADFFPDVAEGAMHDENDTQSVLLRMNKRFLQTQSADGRETFVKKIASIVKSL